MKDIVVVVNIDAKPKPAETLDILLLSTAGQKDPKIYRSLDDILTDYPAVGGVNQVIYSKAEAMFNQGKTTLADTLIRKVTVAGIEKPESPADMIASLEKLQETYNDWYIFLTDNDTDEYIQALAAWAEASEPTEAELGAGIEDHRKLYFAQTNSKTLAVKNARCVITYVDKLSECADAAWLGNVGPFYPQSVTWKFKAPQGLTVPDLTEAERDALEAANINFMSTEYKNEYMKNGVCADGEFIDVQLGADYIAYDMRKNLYAVMLKNAVVPYTDAGFALVAGAVFQTLNKATDLGIIAADPANKKGIYFVTVPKRSEATDDQARARIMPPIYWDALLQGAVHSAKSKGTLRATLSN